MSDLTIRLITLIRRDTGRRLTLRDDALKGRTYIVTGANTGIGYQTVELLAKSQARVIMATRLGYCRSLGYCTCRSLDECTEKRKELVLATGNKAIQCKLCDLTDAKSIRKFAQVSFVIWVTVVLL